MSDKSQSFKLAKVVDVSEVGMPTVRFIGESTPSQKEYSFLQSYKASIGDTVILAAMSDTYVILGELKKKLEGNGYLTEEDALILIQDGVNTAINALDLTNTYAPKIHYHMYLGNSTDGALVEVTMGNDGSLKPTGTKNLGDTGHPWKDLRLSGSLYLSNQRFYMDRLQYTSSYYVYVDSNSLAPSYTSMTLGKSNVTWANIYAATSSIGNSDENLKTDIQELTELEKKVARKLKKLIVTFKFKDAVEQKGEKARIHTGIIAQRVKETFESEGLDPYRYGLFCSDTWYEKNGKINKRNGNPYTEKDKGVTKVTKLGIRYEELLCFIIGAM